MPSATSKNEDEITNPGAAAKKELLHLDFLDGIRALCALYVLLGHVWLQVWPRELGKVPTGIVLLCTRWMSFGHFAVTVFLVISGFCLMLPVVRSGELRGGVLGFFKRRARRILPPYYAAMAFSLVLIYTLIGHKTGTHWDVSLPVTARGLLVHLFLVQNLVHSDQINHAFWSIGTEWQIYFLFPLLIVAWKKFGSVPTTVAALVVSYGLYVLVNHFKSLHIIAPYYLAMFVLGMFASTLAYSSEEKWVSIRQRIPWLWGAAALLAVVIALCAHFSPENPHTVVLDYLVSFVFLGVLVHCSTELSSRLRQMLSWKPLVFVGGFSYSLYLVHAPLIQLVWQYIVNPLHLSSTNTFVLTAALSVAVSLVVAYMFYRVAERPFISSKTAKSS